MDKAIYNQVHSAWLNHFVLASQYTLPHEWQLIHTHACRTCWQWSYNNLQTVLSCYCTAPYCLLLIIIYLVHVWVCTWGMRNQIRLHHTINQAFTCNMENMRTGYEVNDDLNLLLCSGISAKVKWIPIKPVQAVVRCRKYHHLSTEKAIPLLLFEHECQQICDHAKRKKKNLTICVS